MSARWPVTAVVDGLERLGWAEAKTPRQVYQTVRRFQLGWNLGEKLVDDGDPGPITSTALDLSLHRQDDGLTTASEHFSFAQFACKCGGQCKDCERILVRRPLLVALEKYVDTFSPGGVRIASGYRCPLHNKAIGSMADSRHTTGEACDIIPVASWKAVRDLRQFSGIGYQKGTAKVRHVDVRGLCHLDLPKKTPHATVRNPAVWLYS